MAAEDKEHGPVLRPRARILQALGSELISSESVALSELVKNSYDADAARVLVRIDLRRDVIEVIDNGTGMSLSTLRSVWLQPGTPSKLTSSVSAGGRRVLGAKGIGRFAAARLARKLEVFTRTAGAHFEAWVEFDWSLFDDPEAFLDEIRLPSGSRKPQTIAPGGNIEALWESGNDRLRARDLEHGTVLRMVGLKQQWSDSQIQSVRQALSRLIAPEATTDSFAVRLQVTTSGGSERSEEIEPPALLDYPHYTVYGNVEDNGRFRIRLKVVATDETATSQGTFARHNTKPFELLSGDPKRFPDDIRPIRCGPFTIDFRIWDRDDLGNLVQRTGSTLKNVREDLDSIAGISIYRDGFRVLPYGEPNNDWLRLDIRRVQKPTVRLSNNQLHGYIGISADKNPELKDQSNREGLVEGEALQDLKDIVLHILTELELLRYRSRPRKQQTTRQGSKSLFEALSLETLREKLGASARDPKVRQALEVADRQIAQGIKEVQEVLGRYRRLATLGQLIDVVLHDGRQPVASIKNQADLGLEAANRPHVDARKELAPRFSIIHTQAQNLGMMFKRIEPFGGRRRGRPKQLHLEEIVKDAFALFEHEIKSLNVQISISRTQTLVRVDSAELQEVFVNLLQNSLYWLRHVAEDRREIAVEVSRTNEGYVAVVFSDSGPGVPVKHRDSIFEPYFSTKPEGVGLGLTIAGEIASDYYDGSLELLDSGPLPGATFRLTLKKRV